MDDVALEVEIIRSAVTDGNRICRTGVHAILETGLILQQAVDVFLCV